MSNLLHRMLYRIAAFLLPGKAFKTAATGNSNTAVLQTKTALTPVPIFNKQLLNIPAGVANMPTPVLYVLPPPKRAVYTMLIPKPQAAMQTMAAYYQTAKNMIMKKFLSTMMALIFIGLFVQGQTANTQVGANSVTPSSTTEMLYQNNKASVVASNSNTINTTSLSGNVYYIRYSGGENWGASDNTSALTAVFGAFTTTNFVAAVPATIFSPATGFVMMEGGNAGATELNNFLTTNIVLIQNWVAAGGRLYIKAAPNVGGNINLGFGGAVLNYPAFSNTATATIPGHPIFIGPYTPVVTNYTGNQYAHATLSGGTFTNIMNGNAPGCVLGGQTWGSGYVMFGTGTLVGAPGQQPATEAQNLLQNTLSYIGNVATCTGPTITCPPAVTAFTSTNNPGQCKASNVQLGAPVTDRKSVV